MIITSLQLRDIKTDTRLEGVASITFDNMIVIHDIKIISNADGGFFLAMPSRKLPNDTFKDIAHPISKEVRSALERIITDCFAYMRRNNNSWLAFIIKPTVRVESILSQNISDFEIQEVRGYEE